VRNGHLTHIGDADEQGFVDQFMHRHFSTHAVWLGLNDRNTEGVFHWTNGTETSGKHCLKVYVSTVERRR